MNKKEYFKPIAKQIVITNEALLAGSGDPNIATLSFEGDDNGSGEAEAKGNWIWDND